MDAALKEGVEAITKKIGLTYDMKQVFDYEPVAFDNGCVDAVQARGGAFRLLASRHRLRRRP